MLKDYVPLRVDFQINNPTINESPIYISDINLFTGEETLLMKSFLPPPISTLKEKQSSEVRADFSFREKFTKITDLIDQEELETFAEIQTSVPVYNLGLYTKSFENRYFNLRSSKPFVMPGQIRVFSLAFLIRKSDMVITEDDISGTLGYNADVILNNQPKANDYLLNSPQDFKFTSSFFNQLNITLEVIVSNPDEEKIIKLSEEVRHPERWR